VRDGAAHQLHPHHAREHEVVGEPGLARDLGAAVDAAEGLADPPVRTVAALAAGVDPARAG